MFQLIASDLDGTLLNKNCHVSMENLKAAEALAAKGVRLALLTGRCYYEIPREIRTNPAVSYIVSSNGASLIARDGREKKFPIEREMAHEIYEFLKGYDTMIEIYALNVPWTPKETYTRDGLDWYRVNGSYRLEVERSHVPIDSYENLLNETEIEMFDAFFHDPQERLEAWEVLKNRFPELGIASALKSNMEIMRSGVGKDSGFRELSRMSGISEDDMLVLGDSPNDLAVFRYAKHCFAVDNACREIKEIAEKVICSNEEHILAYLEKIL